MKRILVVEDDFYHAEQLRERLKELAPEIENVLTEEALVKLLERSDVPHYDVAVVDMMLRWTDPSPVMDIPKYVLKEGSYVAGLRCWRRLREKGVPCVIFTALDLSLIPFKPGEKEACIVVNKSAGVDVLVERLRPLLR